MVTRGPVVHKCAVTCAPEPTRWVVGEASPQGKGLGSQAVAQEAFLCKVPSPHAAPGLRDDEILCLHKRSGRPAAARKPDEFRRGAGARSRATRPQTLYLPSPATADGSSQRAPRGAAAAPRVPRGGTTTPRMPLAPADYKWARAVAAGLLEAPRASRALSSGGLEGAR